MKISLNRNWKYKKADGGWKEITIPHDAMLSEKRSADAKSGSASGFFSGGKYVYQYEMELSQEMIRKHLTLEFEGVYKNAKVFVNGKEAKAVAYGYVPFSLCLDSLVQEGKNVIRVETDNENQPDSRWYSGAGIYRPVWLHVQEENYISLNGIRITPVSYSPARIKVEVEHNGGTIVTEVWDAENRQKIVDGRGDKVELAIPDARLWSDQDPYLYNVKIKLMNEEDEVECIEKQTGIRCISRDKQGLYINGRKVLLKGGCIHHDNGILGACEYDESAERKIRILKENGFNAIRSAHNPCSEAILRACDKHGMYVMDETWDMWYRKKNAYDYAGDFLNYYKDDIRAIVEKDYNHPSVIMYSIGNEVSEPAEEKGVLLAKEMVDLFHELDGTRMVTGGFNLMIIKNAAKGKTIYKEDGGLDESQSKDMSGMNSTMFNMIASAVGSGMNKSANGKKADQAVSPLLDLLDIAGYNYASGRYKEDEKLHPERLIFGSETFPQDLAKNWNLVQQCSNLIGDFMWTAWDYLGEAGLGAWSYEPDAKGFSKPYPWLLADTGAFDILGNPTGEALWAKAIWEKAEKPEIAVRPCNHPKEQLIKAAWRGTNAIPSWSFSACEENKVTVEVYSKAPYIELYLNGNRIGRRKTKDDRAVFKTRYRSGELEARAIDKDGNLISSHKLQSAQGEIGIKLKAEHAVIGKGHLLYVDVRIADKNGTIESNADERVTLTVKNGTLLALGSANPKTEESYLAGSIKTYYGRALAVIRADEIGKIEITATGNSLSGETLEIVCEES